MYHHAQKDISSYKYAIQYIYTYLCSLIKNLLQPIHIFSTLLNLRTVAKVARHAAITLGSKVSAGHLRAKGVKSCKKASVPLEHFSMKIRSSEHSKMCNECVGQLRICN